MHGRTHSTRVGPSGACAGIVMCLGAVPRHSISPSGSLGSFDACLGAVLYHSPPSQPNTSAVAPAAMTWLTQTGRGTADALASRPVRLNTCSLIPAGLIYDFNFDRSLLRAGPAPRRFTRPLQTQTLETPTTRRHALI